MSKIILIGVDLHGITEEKMALLSECQAVFATKRFTPLLEGVDCPIHPITPQADALAKIEQLLKENATIGMLASGDPLFFGIGQTLVNTFGKDAIEIYPALSSMQIAFARIKRSWQDAHVVSLHGRNSFLKTVLQHQTIFLFTDKTNTPGAIALKILGFIDETPGSSAKDSFQVFVLENLGMPNEKISKGSLSEIAAQSFSDLNVMIVLGPETPSESCPYRFGLTEEEIQHSRGLITKDEVRAVILHKLKLPEEGVLWDIGAGSGSISIEAARLNPRLDIYAVEKNSTEQQNIIANCQKYGLSNLSLVRGQAPEMLDNLPQPDRVFIGGNGGKLPEIISYISQVIRTNGRVILSAVIDATRESAPRLLHEKGFQVEISDVQVTRRAYPEGDRRPVQLNPITIITGRSNDR
nr:precorrin-6y C5,15-methyltransferase (decarboxylating) subunit CbiE [Desulfobulbaceae bacterium]